ncbi:TPA: hypothetical protein DDW35_05425, partial [Candidatus Sumerlaeota bacterium]|nr:hypothetical protein [Candidatus Sumerlaeota bacterium]
MKKQTTWMALWVTAIVLLGTWVSAEEGTSASSSWKLERPERSTEVSYSGGPEGRQNRDAGGPGGGGPDRPMLMSPMPLGVTSDTLQMPEIFRFAAAEFPDLHQRLEKGRGVMPMQEVHEVVLFLKRMQDLQENNPDMYKVEKTIHQLELEIDGVGIIIRKAPGKESAKQRDALKAKLGELFDLREKKREMEARQIEAEVKNIREILAKRQT